MKKKLIAIAMVFALFLSGIIWQPDSVRAAGWLDYVQELTLGNAVTGSMKSGDFYSDDDIWHIYKFTMPENGLLSVYLETESKTYFTGTLMQLCSVSNVDYEIWRDKPSYDYSAARAIYYSSTEISLNRGEYYFIFRKFKYQIDTPYYLTLSCRQPNINIASITLDKTKMTLQPGESRALHASVSPANATDQTLVWRTTNPAAAVVESGVVTAVAAGYASVTVSSSDGEVSAACSITVTEPAAVSEVKTSKTKITKLSSGKKKAKVRFSPLKISGINYQISYRNGKGKWKTKNCHGTSLTIKKLSSKKIYTFRVRGYKKINGRTYYGRWSGTKKVRVK